MLTFSEMHSYGPIPLQTSCKRGLIGFEHLFFNFFPLTLKM